MLTIDKFLRQVVDHGYLDRGTALVFWDWCVETDREPKANEFRTFMMKYGPEDAQLEYWLCKPDGWWEYRRR